MTLLVFQIKLDVNWAKLEDIGRSPMGKCLDLLIGVSGTGHIVVTLRISWLFVLSFAFLRVMVAMLSKGFLITWIPLPYITIPKNKKNKKNKKNYLRWKINCKIYICLDLIQGACTQSLDSQVQGARTHPPQPWHLSLVNHFPQALLVALWLWVRTLICLG